MSRSDNPDPQYMENLKSSIQITFSAYVKPYNVLPYFQKYGPEILIPRDIDRVKAVTCSHGDHQGAEELLNLLCVYEGWFSCMLQVLRDPDVKLGHVANYLVKIKEKLDNDIDQEEKKREEKLKKVEELEELLRQKDQQILELLAGIERGVDQKCSAQAKKERLTHKFARERGASVHSTRTVNAPGHQQSHSSGISSLHGHSDQHSGQSHSTFGHSHPGQAQHPGQTMCFSGQRVDQSSVDSSIFSGRTPGSASNPNLPGEKVDTAAKTEQWVEESLQVFVKNLDGKTHTIEVKRDEEVTVFRQKVFKKLGIPPEQQRLVLQEGRTLVDGTRLCDYKGFKKECNIYCQGRLL